MITPTLSEVLSSPTGGNLPVRFKFWLKDGYIIMYHVPIDMFDRAATDVINRMEQGQDVLVGDKEEHDATLWRIGEHGESLVSHLPEWFSIPNNKVIAYAPG